VHGVAALCRFPCRLLFGSDTLSQWTKKLDQANTHTSPSSHSSGARRSSETSHDAAAAVKRRASASPTRLESELTRSASMAKPDAVDGAASKRPAASEARGVERSTVRPPRHVRRTSLSDTLMEGVKGMESLITKGTLPESVISRGGGAHHSKTPSLDVTSASPAKMVKETVRSSGRCSSVCVGASTVLRGIH
jgi:hypothetical protein